MVVKTMMYLVLFRTIFVVFGSRVRFFIPLLCFKLKQLKISLEFLPFSHYTLFMQRLKAYKYRLYPTKDQEALLRKHFGVARWTYNWCLAKKTELYTKEGKNISKFELMREITNLKKQPETSWLSEVNAQTIQSAVESLDSAYTRFFSKQNKFPKFKSKKISRESAGFRQANRVDFKSGKLFVMKFRDGIKCVFHRKFDGELRTVTISRTSTNKYYASLLVNETVGNVIQQPLDINNSIGIDLGIKSLIVTSDNEIFENPKNLSKYLRKLASASRKLAKKTKGSKNREKQRLKVALIHEKITNKRKDNLHKISRQLVSENQATTYCLEDLNVSGMLKNRNIARVIGDAGWGTFVTFLTYKSEWAGKNILKIGRFEPSSKTCDHCGKVNNQLKLSDRIWTCVCGAVHERDFLAARNIKQFAFHPQNLIRQRLPKSKPVEKPA